ncbi:hypothetical protein L6R53_14105 [Myxococcota bacterium]|nr:hypothetical protein [Myxococcota bacterium]
MSADFDGATILAEITQRLNAKARADLRALDKHPDELQSRLVFRCPVCGWRSSPAQADKFEVYGEGDHDVTYNHCGADFQVETQVTHIFISPAARTAPAPGGAR